MHQYIKDCSLGKWESYLFLTAKLWSTAMWHNEFKSKPGFATNYYYSLCKHKKWFIKTEIIKKKGARCSHRRLHPTTDRGRI